ncbi:MAG TPA: SRPBCC domain-containing protein [Bryobacteraceae bacterium]|nr:SRPBCC domain-containing protein [Bryobacteraceae bacterium]
MADIRHSLQISASRETVYALVSTAAGLAQWWAADVRESGGKVELGFFNRSTVYRLSAVLADPPGRFAWVCETGQEWAGTRLVFQLEAAGSGTLVRFTHAGWQADTDYFVSCTTAWGELMFRLKAAAEGRPRGPLFLADGLAY